MNNKETEIFNKIGLKYLNEILKKKNDERVVKFVSNLIDEVNSGTYNMSYKFCGIIIKYLGKNEMSIEDIQRDNNISYRMFRERVVKHLTKVQIKGLFSALEYEQFKDEEKSFSEIGIGHLKKLIGKETEKKLKGFLEYIVGQVETGNSNLTYDDCAKVLDISDESSISKNEIMRLEGISYHDYREKILPNIEKLKFRGQYSRLDYEVYFNKAKMGLIELDENVAC